MRSKPLPSGGGFFMPALSSLKKYSRRRHLPFQLGPSWGYFLPDVIAIPVQGDHYDFHWDGRAVDQVFNRTTRQTFLL